MSFKLFMKKNKKAKENTTFPATKSLVDEKGKPLLWEIRQITTKENDEITEECMSEVPIAGKPGMYRQKLNSTLYMRKTAAASIVSPDLYNAELQDSYGVKTPEDLLVEIVNSPGEYNDFIAFITEFNDFKGLEEETEQAKN